MSPGLAERETYKFKKRPYRHQVAALKDLLERGWGGALLMEPRTGKTKVAVDWMSILHQRGRVNRVLIVCPVSAIGDTSQGWIREIMDNCPHRWRITIWDKDGRKEVDLPKWGQDVLDIVILNFDAFSTPGKLRTVTKGKRKGEKVRSRKGGKYELVEKLRRWQPQAMIVDESHRMKTPSAAKTKMIAKVAHEYDQYMNYQRTLIPHRVILTGTVLTKKKRIFDIYSQWRFFLNPMSPLVKGHTLKSFKEAYAVWTDRNGYPQWLRNKESGMKKLRKLLHAESFAITREECFDLPPRMPDNLVNIPLTGKSAEVYDQMAEEMVAMIKSGEYTTASIPLVQTLRLLQATSGIAKTDPTEKYPEGRLVRVGRDKLTRLEDLCTDWWEADQKVVICARFKGDMVAIQKLCDKHKIKHWCIRGGQKRAERTSGIAAFNKHDGPGVMIIQPSAGSEGIDLRTASIFVWYSFTGSWVQFRQVEDRIALSPVSTSYFYFIGGPVDMVAYETLQEDGNMAAALTKSPDRLLRNFKVG